MIQFALLNKLLNNFSDGVSNSFIATAQNHLTKSRVREDLPPLRGCGEYLDEDLNKQREEIS